MKLIILNFIALLQTKVVKNTNNFGYLKNTAVKNVNYIKDEYCVSKSTDLSLCILCMNSSFSHSYSECVAVEQSVPHCISYYEEGKCLFC